MYSIVDFPDGFHMVAAKWIDTTTSTCWWPNLESNDEHLLAVKEERDINKTTWACHKYSKVMGYFETFDMARLKLREAESHSDLNTDVDQAGEIRKRRRKPNSKYLETDSDGPQQHKTKSSSNTKQTEDANITRTKSLPELPPIPPIMTMATGSKSVSKPTSVAPTIDSYFVNSKKPGHQKQSDSRRAKSSGSAGKNKSGENDHKEKTGREHSKKDNKVGRKENPDKKHKMKLTVKHKSIKVSKGRSSTEKTVELALDSPSVKEINNNLPTTSCDSVKDIVGDEMDTSSPNERREMDINAQVDKNKKKRKMQSSKIDDKTKKSRTSEHDSPKGLESRPTKTSVEFALGSPAVKEMDNKKCPLNLPSIALEDQMDTNSSTERTESNMDTLATASSEYDPPDHAMDTVDCFATSPEDSANTLVAGHQFEGNDSQRHGESQTPIPRLNTSAGNTLHVDPNIFLDEIEFKKHVVTELLQIKLALRRPRGPSIIQQVLPSPEDDLPDLYEKVKSVSELKNLSTKLASDKALSHRMVGELKKIGGMNADKVVKAILSRLITPEVGEKFSWRGGKGKEKFCELHGFLKVLFDSVRTTKRKGALIASELTREDMADSIAEWLRQAIGGAKRARAAAERLQASSVPKDTAKTTITDSEEESSDNNDGDDELESRPSSTSGSEESEPDENDGETY